MGLDKITVSPFNFEQLQIYRDVLAWITDIYSVTGAWPQSELFGLTSQLRRAAISIALNIAEGSGRTRKDFAHFLTLSRGSCYECVAILAIAEHQGYITEAQYAIHYDKCNRFARTINSLRRSIKP
jgi:four helix bundle protein